MTRRYTQWLAVATTLYHLICPTAAVNVNVSTSCSTYTGLAGSDGIASWLGIRYAAPPLGELRFMPPKDPSCSDGVQLPDHTHGKICLATGGSPTATKTSEDCLFLDIYAPSNATSKSKLPVYFFIQGGGFNTNSNPNYNGKGLIQASGYNIVVVTFNYRVGPYGFLTNGDLVTPNNGLLDQRKALEWVNKYISFFGGNPDHVVIGGNSAGAASVSLQLAAYGGNPPTKLFVGAAAESVSFATVLTVAEAQYQYDNFALAAGCAGTAKSSLACLRSKTAVELQTVNTGSPFPGAPATALYPWGPVVDGTLITNLTYDAYAQGEFVRVPLLIGDDTNEGTTFAPKEAASIGDSDTFLKSQFPYLTLEQLSKINGMYPNPANASCPAAGCYWRQTSDAYGDIRYICPGLFISDAFADAADSRAPAYNYRWNVEDPTQVSEGLGVPHTVEVNAIFGPDNVPNAPASYFPGGVNAPAVPVIQAYWTSFIRSLDPNKYRAPGAARWEVWSPDAQRRLLFSTGGKTAMEVIPKDMQAKCQYLQSIGAAIRQ